MRPASVTKIWRTQALKPSACTIWQGRARVGACQSGRQVGWAAPMRRSPDAAQPAQNHAVGAAVAPGNPQSRPLKPPFNARSTPPTPHVPKPPSNVPRGGARRPRSCARPGLLLLAGLAGLAAGGGPGHCGAWRTPIGRWRQCGSSQVAGQGPVAPLCQPASTAAQRGPGSGTDQCHDRGHQRPATRHRHAGAHRSGRLRVQAVGSSTGAGRQAGSVHGRAPRPPLRDGPARDQHWRSAPGRPRRRRDVAADPCQIDADECPPRPAHGRQLPAC